MSWRETALSQHPYRAVVTHRWILPNQMITALSRVRAKEIYGLETVSKIADRTEEWTSTYASDIYNVISQFDEEKHVQKLWVRLVCDGVKVVKSAAWQRQIRTRYIENAECALIIAEGVLEDISKFKKAVGNERKELLALDGTTADDLDGMKRMVRARCSQLRWMLEDAVWNLHEYCKYLKEAISWSDGLAARDDDEAEGEEPGNSNKVVIHLLPPVRRSSRQSM